MNNVKNRFKTLKLKIKISKDVNSKINDETTLTIPFSIENVRMLDRFNNRKLSVGTLYLTTTHLIFVDPENKKETWILHMHIASLDKLPLTTSGSPLQIKCKTFLCVTFVIPKERECHDIYLSLLQLAQPVNIQDLYCFHYTASNEDVSQTAGWFMFDLQSEFQRMGVPNENWCLTTINKEYEVCDTYPQYLHVPRSTTTPILVGSSRFRSRGRLPVLSYLHKNQGAITRCSQPLAGFSARCVEDEQMLNCILRANPNSNFMYVVDTRPRINAMANRAAGKGYENENFYENIKFQFLGIENIHVMRNSLQKLIEASELKVPSINAFLSGLESSGWLKHIKSLFDTSVFIANAIIEGISVLVHCSDGWDRTAQTCSLAQILLDPFYRTLAGFQSLVEKEWLSFGHKFTDRCGFIQGDAKETSPVFTQFIDCIWQLMQQFPLAFQFNERFLLTLHDHVYSCQFGTFVGNCEKDRLDLRLNERTYSLWGYIANHMSEFVNPLYKKNSSSNSYIIPNLSPQMFKFWRGMYNRFENGVHPREPMTDLLCAAKDHSSSLENHIKLLQKRIALLKEMLGHADTPSKDIDSMMNDSGLIESTNLDPADSILAKYRDADCRLSYVSVLSDSESGVEDMRDGVITSPDSTSSNKLQLISDKGTVDGSHLLEQLSHELDSVAIDWKSFRNIKECICSTPFDYFSRKYHCWKCGEVFCVRCIDKHIPLPGHFGKNVVPVCRPCFKELKRSSSEDS